MTQPSQTYKRPDSELEGINSAVKLLCLCLVSASIAHCTSVIGFAAAAVVTAALVYLSSLPIKKVLRTYGRLAGLFVFIILINTLFYSREYCFAQWWIFCPSVIGTVKGAAVVVRAMLITAAFEVFASSVSPTELSDTFALILSPLRYMGIPSAKTAVILSESVCIIPKLLLFFDETREQGMTMGRGAGRYEKQTIIRPVVLLLLSALRNAEARGEYLESRGMGLDGKALPYYSDGIKAMSIYDLYAFLVCASLWALEVVVL